MALDFPSSPTNGQVYGNFVYSSAKGAWQAKPITGKVTTSATAPSAPSNGDEWFNTNDGNIYVYYTDVDGSQWVQVKSDATLSSTLGNRVTSLESTPSGLVPVIPTSITLGSGTGSVAADGTVTFSNASSFTLNGAFTSAYKNYRVIVYRLAANSAAQVDGRFSVSGTPLTSNSYYTAASYQRADGVSGVYGGFNGIGYTELCPATNELGWSTIVWDIFQPAVSDAQTGSFFNSSGYSTSIQNRQGHVMYNATTVIDGINLFANISTNISGVVKVYGYR